MSNPPSDDLLGYVLGALDADQQRAMQKRLDQQPELEEQLLDIKSSLLPLQYLDDADVSRPGLARRTCEMVASACGESCLVGSSAVVRPGRRSPAPMFSLASPASFSRRDAMVTTIALAVFLAVLFPLIAHYRNQARRLQCQSNLRSIGMALATFSDSHQGKFPEIPASGPLAFAGSYGPQLLESGYLEDSQLLTCAGVNRDEPLVIPTREQILLSASKPDYQRLRRIAGGDFGYSLGYKLQGRYVSPRNEGHAYQILMADKPPRFIGGPSENHGGDGQNCLLGDFSVRYVVGCTHGDDSVFVNDQNMVSPGIGPHDAVIAASHVPPGR